MKNSMKYETEDEFPPSLDIICLLKYVKCIKFIVIKLCYNNYLDVICIKLKGERK